MTQCGPLNLDQQAIATTLGFALGSDGFAYEKKQNSVNQAAFKDIASIGGNRSQLDSCDINGLIQDPALAGSALRSEYSRQHDTSRTGTASEAPDADSHQRLVALLQLSLNATGKTSLLTVDGQDGVNTISAAREYLTQVGYHLESGEDILRSTVGTLSFRSVYSKAALIDALKSAREKVGQGDTFTYIAYNYPEEAAAIIRGLQYLHPDKMQPWLEANTTGDFGEIWAPSAAIRMFASAQYNAAKIGPIIISRLIHDLDALPE